MVRMRNRTKHTAVSTALPLRQGGRYATLFVGPVFGLASLGVHAQEQAPTPTPMQTQQIAAPEAASAATPATAQSNAAPSTPAAETSTAQGKDGATLNTVVVTATRRREPAREVPMQVDTLSTEKLEESGAKTLSDYLADEPGIDVKTTGGAGNNASKRESHRHL